MVLILLRGIFSRYFFFFPSCLSSLVCLSTFPYTLQYTTTLMQLRAVRARHKICDRLFRFFFLLVFLNVFYIVLVELLLLLLLLL